uniref:Uncharacterized protein n=1 Tax=Candidatus Kentrum sp. LPFa TaxID=2126335 RepID=A0A450WJU6_9GAMM|nr:MAG: hypothetical protein BECKLPF1236B_GA0070989_11145 [Candidatus Kentron sp. LPFa]
MRQPKRCICQNWVKIGDAGNNAPISRRDGDGDNSLVCRISEALVEDSCIKHPQITDSASVLNAYGDFLITLQFPRQPNNVQTISLKIPTKEHTSRPKTFRCHMEIRRYDPTQGTLSCCLDNLLGHCREYF